LTAIYISWQDFSLPHADGTFFLRPDAILAVYIIGNSEDLPAVNMIAIAEAKYERHRDQVGIEKNIDLRKLLMSPSCGQIADDVYILGRRRVTKEK
jgi:hypothetical protein